MTEDRGELQNAVNACGYWYHRIELPGGVLTPGWAPLAPDAYPVPADLTGKTVLDIGAWDGYWSFEAAKRGAKFVVAIDDFSDTLGSQTNADRSHRWRNFDLCCEALGYSGRVARETCSVDDIGGKFDYVFCFGLLYHLRHPLHALEKIRGCCREAVCIETAILDGCRSAYGDYVYDGSEMLCEFYPEDQYGQNASNWWVATLRCWTEMVRSAGFTDVRSHRLCDRPKHVSQARGFIYAAV